MRKEDGKDIYTCNNRRIEEYKAYQFHNDAVRNDTKYLKTTESY